jgi:mRNA-degrading endonuclease toxin of MazEF toxin-antitoxin module
MDSLRRGDIVTIALQGDFGKPRPAVVVQSDLFNANHATLTVLLISSEIVEDQPGSGRLDWNCMMSLAGKTGAPGAKISQV